MLMQNKIAVFGGVAHNCCVGFGYPSQKSQSTMVVIPYPDAPPHETTQTVSRVPSCTEKYKACSLANMRPGGYEGTVLRPERLRGTAIYFCGELRGAAAHVINAGRTHFPFHAGICVRCHA